MIVPIVKYGDPALRRKGARVERVTPEIRQLIEDMFDTMYAAKGVGLAAQQIGRALQVAVIDVRAVTDRPSSLELNGQPADVSSFMPLVLINPELQPIAEAEVGPEGCLSFPEVYADISRPAMVEVKTLDEEGTLKTFRCGGLLSRAIQHETDHLHGVLFIDRMSPAVRDELRAELEGLQAATKESARKKK